MRTKIKGLTWLAALLCLCSAPPLFARDAGQLTCTTSLEKNRLTLEIDVGRHKIEKKAGGELIEIDGCTLDASPGNPIVPHRVYRLALPPDAVMESVRIEVTGVRRVELGGGYTVAPGSSIMTWENGKAVESWGKAKEIANGRNRKVYEKDAAYPEQEVILLPAAQIDQMKIVQLDVFPVRYQPASGRLSLIKHLTVHVRFDTAGGGTVRQSAAMSDLARETVDNYAQVAPLYQTSMLAPGQYDYVIITPNHLVSFHQSYLAEWENLKEKQGYTVLTVTEDSRYDDLESSPAAGGFGGGTGVTASNNIRAWLVNNYSTMGIQYALLIGDPTPETGDVPMRLCHPGADLANVSTDYYYADLTSNWDANGNGVLGEFEGDVYDSFPTPKTGGIDRDPEIYVGRICVYLMPGAANTLDQILTKSLMYQTSTEFTSWRYQALLGMIAMHDYYPAETRNNPVGERIRNVYLTPRGWTACREYTYPDYFDTYIGGTVTTGRDYANSYAQTLSLWSTNYYGIVTWLSHGARTLAENMFRRDDFYSLNDWYPSFVISGSCDTGSPYVNTMYGTVDKSLIVSLHDNGAIASIGSSNNSYYRSTDSSHYYETQDGLNQCLVEGISKHLVDGYGVSKALTRTKLTANLSALDDIVAIAAWKNFLQYNLYGVPEVGVYDGTEVFAQHGETNNLMVVNNQGNLLVRGPIVPGCASITPDAGVEVWTLKQDGTIVAMLDLTGANAGRLKLTGQVYPRNTPSTSHLFCVKNEGGTAVASFDSTGNLYVSGFQGFN